MSSKLHHQGHAIIINTYTYFLIYRKLTEEKTKEKDALDESVKQVRGKTTSHINDMHTVVDDKIKTMAWNSHARQTKVRFLEAAPN